MKTDMKEMRERMDKKIRSTENMSPLAVEPPKKFAPYDKLNGNENLRESVQAKLFPQMKGITNAHYAHYSSMI